MRDGSDETCPSWLFKTPLNPWFRHRGPNRSLDPRAEPRQVPTERDVPSVSQVTKVSTSRPVPENPYHSRPRPEPNPTIEGKLEPSKYGSRLFFWNW